MPKSPPPKPADANSAPRWLAGMRKSEVDGDHVKRPRGFYVNYDKFAAIYSARGKKRLVVAFDNLSSVNDDSLARETWGDKFYSDNNYSSLGILSFDANWYRDEVLFDYLEGLCAQGFFKQFKHVVFTGTSMGGYAACAFSGLAPGSTVIAYSPQSTLKKDLVPWEKRFNRGRRQDWSGRYQDAALHTGDASKVYLCYDPYMEGDKRHADRFSGQNIVHLPSNYVGHKTVVFLRRAEVLKQVTALCMENRMTPARFAALYRKRRLLPWYYFGLMDLALERGHRQLSDRIIRAAEAASGNVNLEKILRNRRKKFWEAQKDMPTGREK
ncbi:MAG: hypothetical protein GXP05_03570 [Alphaproteobacteria bacterium]|nr:hypothetical protein [Alphaproteobacteria bacterium]